MKLNKLSLIMTLTVSSFLHSSQIIVPPPECPAYDRTIPISNSQVLNWKQTTKNQFRARGHVSGTVSQVYSDKNGHAHFAIQIGKRAEDTLEVIYNEDFGRIPDVHPGMAVQACGDYITSTHKSGNYPASPDGAIIHWIHMNPSSVGHLPGYLMIDSKLYGQDAENARPRP